MKAGGPHLHFAKPVAETLGFSCGISLDVSHDGDLLGLEFLSRPDLVANLKAAGML